MAKISTIYTIRNSKDEIVTTIDSGTRDTSTSLVLHGKGAPEYGLDRDQSLVYLLENFSNTTAPANPIVGQLWWKIGDEMFVFDDSGSPATWASVVPPPLGLGFDVAAGAGLIGGGFPTLSPLGTTIHVGAGTGIRLGSPVGSPIALDSVSTKDSEIVHDNLSGSPFGSALNTNRHINHSSVTITAGVGLSGGGDLTQSRTVAVEVAAGGGLAVTANQLRFGSPTDIVIAYGSPVGSPQSPGSPFLIGPLLSQSIAGIKTFRAPILANEGNATAPTFSFEGDTDTGWYNVDAAGALAFTTGGAERFRIESDGTLSATSGSPNYTTLVTAGSPNTIPNKEYVDNQAASGTSPTSNIFTGTSTITGLDATKKYLVSIYGVVNSKGGKNAWFDTIQIRSGTVLGSGTLLAATGRQWINWPNGDIPVHNVFVIDMTTAGGATSLHCQVNNSTYGGTTQYSTQIRAMQLD